MQIFITSADPCECASNLDTRRLLKQVVEASQVINALEGKTLGWRNHPATLQWAPYLPYLQHMKNCFAAELRTRKTKTGKDFNLKSRVFDHMDLPDKNLVV